MGDRAPCGWIDGPYWIGHTPDLRDWRFGVGIFTTDPVPIRFPLSMIGTLHIIFGTSQLMLLPFAALLINLSLALKSETWARARRVLLWTAGLPLFGFGRPPGS